MNHNPREFQRVYLTFYMRVYIEDKFAGFLIDVSEEGLMLMSEHLIETGQEYTFKMKLPSSLEWEGKRDEDKHVAFTAKCMWSKNDEVDKNFYLSGYHFVEMSDHTQKILHDIIQEYKTNNK